MVEGKNRKIYYSMGEVAEMFDVNQSLIRFWEQKFDILKPHKNKKGNRMFTPQDIENLKLIYHLVKEKGMTLVGAQKRIKENKEGIGRDMEIVERLQSIRTLLMEVKQELKDGKGMDANGEYDWNESPPAPDSTQIVELEPLAVKKQATVSDTPLRKIADEAARTTPTGKVESTKTNNMEAMGPQPRIVEQTLF